MSRPSGYQGNSEAGDLLGDFPTMGAPSKVMLPCQGFNTPAMHPRVVDLLVHSQQGDQLSLADLEGDAGEGRDRPVACMDFLYSSMVSLPPPPCPGRPGAQPGFCALLRCAFAYRPAEVQHVQPVTQTHDQAHIMVDDQHAQVLFGGQRCQHLEQFLALVLVQPGSRLIQEEELRLRCQRPGHFHPPLETVGQHTGQHLRPAGDADLLEHFRARSGGHPCGTVPC